MESDSEPLGPAAAAHVASPAAEAEPPAPAGVADPPMEKLDPRLVPYWTVVNLITTAVLGGALALGIAYLLRADSERADWYLYGGGGLVAALLLLSVLQPILAFLTWRYGMDERLLVARYGILFREEKTIPISRLQHVDLRRGPIERLFSLATLVVFTAGTEGASFRVPGLTAARAQEMRDRILAARGDDVI